jgi:outer membrane protein assembly factor BamA
MMHMTKALKVLMVCFLLAHATNILAQENLVIKDDFLVINDIMIQGNAKTREHVILRELVFSIGDTVQKMELLPSIQRSKDNLLNLTLFNFVNFGITHLGENRIDVSIDITERWYIWPVPILEYSDRNFSSFLESRDWSKINYGVWLQWKNFRGRNDLLSGKIRLGYIKEYALSYSLPNLGKNQRHGVSTGFNMNQQNVVFIATRFNKPVEYRPADVPAQTRLNAFGRYTYRRQHYTTHSMELQYYDYQVSDSVAAVNSNYLGGGNNRLNYFVLSYKFNYDIRDSKVYPLEGFNVRLRADQIGLGLISDHAYPTFRLTGVMMYHHKLANRLYFYNASKFRYSSEKHMPHLLNKALGYNEFLSGYEAYVIDGSDYVISKYNVKVQVIKPSSFTIPFIGMKQFNRIHYALYFNAFADAGYVNNIFPDPTNTMVNTWQFSAGVGFDLVTYYDQVFSINYAINRYGEHGFFIHVETPFARW